MGQVCTGSLTIDLLTLESCGRLDRNGVGFTGISVRDGQGRQGRGSWL